MPHTTITGWNHRCPSCDRAIVLVLEIARLGDEELVPSRRAWTCPACEASHAERLLGEVIAVKLLDAIENEIALGSRRLPRVS